MSHQTSIDCSLSSQDLLFLNKIIRLTHKFYRLYKNLTYKIWDSKTIEKSACWPGVVAHSCNLRILGGWGRRITLTQEAEVAVSLDRATALQPGDRARLRLQNKQTKNCNLVALAKSSLDQIGSVGTSLQGRIKAHQTHMVCKGPQLAKTTLKKKNKMGGLTSWFQNLLQSNNNQDGVVLAQR